jgi:predicted lipoprotein with Yx(FWY)xxD motif
MSRVPAVIGALVLGVAISACGGSSSGGGSTGGPTTASTQSTVSLGTTNIGSVLVDNRGRTLYLLSADTAGHSNCPTSCQSVWMPLTAGGGAAPKAAAGVTGALASITGSGQVTIAGHPLYTYAGDSAIGEANGEGKVSYGGTWHAVTATGAPVASSPSSSSAPSPTSSSSAPYHY